MEDDGEDVVEVLPEDSQKTVDLTFKLIVLGDSGVGKSCFTTRGSKDEFGGKDTATVGFEYQTITMRINDKTVKLQIWDTCGQEQYKSLVTNFFRNSALAIVMYAIDNKKSFDNVMIWLNEVKSKANPNVQIFLIGNKSDLESKRQVTKKEGQTLKNEQNFQLFMEASALSGQNVQKIFIEAGKLLLNDYNAFRTSIDYNNRVSNATYAYQSLGGANNVVVPKPPEKNSKKKKSCC